eukprot:505519-Prymnesium_polylepis.2
MPKSDGSKYWTPASLRLVAACEITNGMPAATGVPCAGTRESTSSGCSTLRGGGGGEGGDSADSGRHPRARL